MPSLSPTRRLRGRPGTPPHRGWGTTLHPRAGRYRLSTHRCVTLARAPVPILCRFRGDVSPPAESPDRRPPLGRGRAVVALAHLGQPAPRLDHARRVPVAAQGLGVAALQLRGVRLLVTRAGPKRMVRGATPSGSSGRTTRLTDPATRTRRAQVSRPTSRRAPSGPRSRSAPPRATPRARVPFAGRPRWTWDGLDRALEAGLDTGRGGSTRSPPPRPRPPRWSPEPSASSLFSSSAVRPRRRRPAVRSLCAVPHPSSVESHLAP